MSEGAIPTGFEPIQSSNPYAGMSGPLYERVEGGNWVRGFRVAEKHTNSAGVVHGGMLMTFADVVAARALLADGYGRFVTVNMGVNFTAPARLGDWVEGVAETQSVADGVAHISGVVRTEKHQLADFLATFRILD